MSNGDILTHLVNYCVHYCIVEYLLLYFNCNFVVLYMAELVVGMAWSRSHIRHNKSLRHMSSAWLSDDVVRTRHHPGWGVSRMTLPGGWTRGWTRAVFTQLPVEL